MIISLSHPALLKLIDGYAKRQKRAKPIAYIASTVMLILGLVFCIFGLADAGIIFVLFAFLFYFLSSDGLIQKEHQRLIRDLKWTAILNSEELLIYNGLGTLKKEVRYHEITEMELIDIYAPTGLPFRNGTFTHKEKYPFICLHIGYSIRLPDDAISAEYQNVPHLVLLPYQADAWDYLKCRLSKSNARISERSNPHKAQAD